MGNNNLDVLDEINKGCTMGMDALNFVMDKVENSAFKEVLDGEYLKYKNISVRVNDIYNNYTLEKEPHKTNAMNKMMTWSGIEMKTMMDKSDSKISELLVTGTNMGIIEGRRLLNHNKDLPHEIHQVLNDFVVMQEDSVETLKKYL